MSPSPRPGLLSGADEVPIAPLSGKTIALLGYGNQGCAHARNLAESGLRVIVGSRMGTPAAARAAQDGFEVSPLETAAAAGDLVILALPDEVHGTVFPERVGPHLNAGAVLGVLHGFSLRYSTIAPPPEVGVVMVAPKGPGTALRERFVRGEGLPCLFAVERETPAPARARDIALAWAAGLGCHRAAVVETTVAIETETDLFGEQAVLCGGMTGLMLAAFETLLEAGYPADVAYMECAQEVKQVADLVFERGLPGMLSAISSTAEFGALTAGMTIVDDATRQRMREILDRVRDGTFAERFLADHAAGSPIRERARRRASDHSAVSAGDAVRAWMPWLTPRADHRPGPDSV